MSVSIAVIRDTISLDAEFILNTSPKTIRVRELGDLPGLPFDLFYGDTLKGLIKVVAPDGSTIREGNIASPDFLWNDVTTDNELTGVSLPNDVNGTPMLGDYTFTYDLHYYDAGTDTTTIITTVVVICLAALTPTGDLTAASNCHESKLTVTDATSYPAGTVVTRSMTIKAPFNADGTAVTADVTTTQSTRIVTPIYTGVYSLLLDNTVRIPLGDGGYIINDVTASETHEVKCDNNLCDIFCCINTLTSRMNRAKYSNAKLYQELYYQWVQLIGYYVLYRQAIECGMYDTATLHYAHILVLGGCTAGCGCSDTTPQLVIAVGGGPGADVDVEAGTGILVSLTMNGDTKVYTVTLNPTVTDRIAALEAISIVIENGSPTYYSIVNASGTHTFTWAGPKLDRLDFLIDIDLSGGPNYAAAFVKKEMMAFGGRYQNDGLAANVSPQVGWLGATPAVGEATANEPMIYRIHDFLANSGADVWVDKAFLQVVHLESTSDDDVRATAGSYDLQLEVVKSVHNEIWFRFLHSAVSGAFVTTHHPVIEYGGIRKITVHASITPRSF